MKALSVHPGILIILALCAGGFAFSVRAQDTSDLDAQIQEKQSRVKEIEGLIGSYNERIKEQESQKESLENQIVMLENRVKEKELSVERSRIEIESLQLEIQRAGKEIDAKEQKITSQKEMIADMIRSIYQADEISTLDVLLSNQTLAEFFSAIEEVKSVNQELGQAVGRMKEAKTQLEAKKQAKQEKQTGLEIEQRALKKEMLALEAEKNFKESLIAQTKQNEQEFQRILYELRQQQESTADEISDLERRLKAQLESVDDALARGNASVAWPIDPSPGITTIFHDPGYPFKNLFEHPGVDIRAKVGTPIKSAAGGYVAWNKTGRMYGNYTMVIHAGGLATVYAHLSKFLAEPDTFVERGDPIGLSGGMPGMQGAGLSTGPHLHFEVRKDGIPVDPEKYLPQIPNDYYDYYDDYKRWGLRL